MRLHPAQLLLLFFLSFVQTAPAVDLCTVAKDAMRRATEIRGLKPKRKVPCHARTKKKIKTYVVEAVEKETPRERVIGEGILYKAIGIVPKKFDYAKELVDLYTSQIGGYYDPKRDHFVMAAWMPASLQYPIAVHELVHALQDQYFDLEKFMDIKTMSSDQLMARSALVEGDATTVMIDHSVLKTGQGSILDREDINLFLAQNVIGAQMLGGAHPDKQALMQLIIFPYSSGFRFAHELAKKEKSYSALDAAFGNPPRSTEEILHPEKYGSKEPDFQIPDLPEREGLIHRDSLGEFFLSVWLSSQGVSGPEAAKAAAGWGGDSAGVFEEDGAGHTVHWYLRFDTKPDVSEFLQALSKSKVKKDTFICKGLLCKGTFEAP